MHASADRELLSKSIVSDQMRNCLVLSFVLPYVQVNLRARRVRLNLVLGSPYLSAYATRSMREPFIDTRQCQDRTYIESDHHCTVDDAGFRNTPREDTRSTRILRERIEKMNGEVLIQAAGGHRDQEKESSG
jgi:hypothetical protein